MQPVRERPVPEGWATRERLCPIAAPSAVCDAILSQELHAIADAVDGLDSEDPDPARQRRYEDFCFPYDKPASRPRLADDLSACVIVVFAVLDCLGYDSPQTDTAYHPRLGRAVADLVTLAKNLDAWLREVGRERAWHDATVPGSEATLPRGPFVALIGNNGSEGAEHGLVGLEGLDDDLVAPTLEGGLLTRYPKGKGGYRIQKCAVELQIRGPGNVWVRRISPAANAWRRLRGWLDLMQVPFTQRATLPLP